MSSRPSPIEDRLDAARAAVTPDVDVDRLLRDVDRRLTARARRRRRRGVVAATSFAAACAAVVVVFTLSGRPSDVRTVGPAATEPATGPTAPGPEPTRWGPAVDVPGAGDRLTALGSDATGFWVARGGSDGATTAPDTITRFELDGTAGASTELQGAALTGAADNVSLWVLVEEPAASTSPGPLRLKHIDRDDGRLVASHAVPLTDIPIAIELSPGEVTVRSPTREVVFDREGHVLRGPLASDLADEPQVTVDGLRWSTDGPTTVRVDAVDGATSATIELPGVRRLTAASALGSGDVVAEVDHDGDSELVHLRLDDAGIRSSRVRAFDPTATIAAIDAERVWVIRGDTLLSITR